MKVIILKQQINKSICKHFYKLLVWFDLSSGRMQYYLFIFSAPSNHVLLGMNKDLMMCLNGCSRFLL